MTISRALERAVGVWRGQGLQLLWPAILMRLVGCEVIEESWGRM